MPDYTVTPQDKALAQRMANGGPPSGANMQAWLKGDDAAVPPPMAAPDPMSGPVGGGMPMLVPKPQAPLDPWTQAQVTIAQQQQQAQPMAPPPQVPPPAPMARPMPHHGGMGGAPRDPALAMASPMERQLRGNIQGDELDKRNALAEQGQVQQQRAQAQYQQMAENQAMQEHLQATQQLAEQKREAESRDRLAQLQSRADQLAGEKVDPNRLYANASTGSKIMAGIGLLFGALGAGGTGGENKSVGIIKDAIDRDIMAQKANIANKQESMSQARGLYQDRLKQYGDERQAALATKIDMLAIAQAKIQTTAAQYDSPEIKAKADQAVADLKKESDTLGLNWYNTDKARAQALAAAAAAHAAAIAKENRDHAFSDHSKLLEGRIDIAKENAKDGGKTTVHVDGPNGPVDMRAATQEDAMKLREGQAIIQKMDKGIERLKELRAKHGGGAIPFGESANDRTEATSIAKGLAEDQSKLADQGVITAGDRSSEARRLGENPLEMSIQDGLTGADTYGTQLDSFQRQIHERRDAALQARLTKPPATAEQIEKKAGIRTPGGK